MARAAADIQIDDLRPSEVVDPRSAAEAAQVLNGAREDGLKVVPVGGQTALALGNRPTRVDIALSTRNLSGVIAYEPTDLTLSVLAGTPMTDLQATLAEHGQTLPVDVPRIDDATVGGVIATNIFGPRRSGSPTFRDLLIGISAAHPNGTVTKAGGMVVKNVSGFDLMRVYLGSLGTLGVIVSANFKVLPRARHEVTLIARFSDLHAALSAADRVRHSRILPTSLEVFSGQQFWSVATRIEGRESTVRLLADEAVELLESDRTMIEGSDSAAWWQHFTDEQAIEAGPTDAVMRAGVRPRMTSPTAPRLLTMLEEQGADIRNFSITPSLGQMTLRVRIPGEVDECELFVRLHTSLSREVDNLIVLAVPPAWKQSIDIWGRMPETIELMRSLKHQFDPEAVLNPGRFAGRI